MPFALVFNRNRQTSLEESPAFAHVAERFRRAGELQRAVSLCRDGLRRFPDHVSARVTLGLALVDLGKHADARNELKLALKLAPDNLAAIRGMAHLHDHGDQGDQGDQGEHLEEVLPSVEWTPSVETFPSMEMLPSEPMEASELDALDLDSLGPDDLGPDDVDPVVRAYREALPIHGFAHELDAMSIGLEMESRPPESLPPYDMGALERFLNQVQTRKLLTA